MAEIDLTKLKNSIKKGLPLKRRRTLFLILGAISVVVTFCAIYFGLMPINFASGGFKAYLVFMALLWSVPMLFKVSADKKIVTETNGKKVSFAEFVKSNKDEGQKGQLDKYSRPKLISFWSLPLLLAAALVLLMIVLSIGVSPLFKSTSYRDLINVSDNADFLEGVENYDTMQIPVVDAALADKLGDKKLGEDNYGSQFEVGTYTMITYNDTLYWIAPIEYRGFFQWTSKPASPGYLLINATDQSDVRIVRDELNYVDSAYLHDDLNRKIYFSSMTRYREKRPHLELDDNGRPMFVDAVLKKKFAFTSGVDSVGVIITDAKTGESKFYETGSVPSWVDRIQPASIVEDQLNFWGNYVHGFFNSLFAKKDVLAVSTGINYVYSNGAMYLQTGMTSVGNDESIVGVSMVDMRTKNTKFYRVAGATEFAAAQSAIGAEQAQRFSASDPIIINFNGTPTYFMMLKDDEGLPKRYAYVNVADYRIVATDENRDGALASYEMKIAPNKVATDVVLTIKEISQGIVVDGNTYYYIKFYRPESGEFAENFEELIFKAPFTLNPALAFMRPGDTVKADLLSSLENLITKIQPFN